ncbi:hypothetical protein BAS10_18520 [Elizabethkingia meningoseptica]|uniref:hypothetical protein n=1 Tax=Elizabethkingia meningoseptica TaxID=238 RepID=UPI0009996310|nr:hypothetical protein [Elizabethkingia meningoseptica]OPC01938.1 hypothetical protein BAS10_18520 [Elizabethkingia meningoseptica]
MKRILTEKMAEVLKDREISDVIDNLLHSEHHMPRSHSAILIGSNINKDYPKYLQLLLNEMNKDIHFLGVRLGVKSAWTIAISLIENLKKEDYPKIKKEFDKWDKEEKEGLLDWLKDFPDHCKILKEGKV